MAELIYESTVRVTAPGGVIYRGLVVGDKRPDGMWSGWIEFQAVDGSPGLATERETLQPSRDALIHWAETLERAFYEAALARAGTIPERPHAAAVM